MCYKPHPVFITFMNNDTIKIRVNDWFVLCIITYVAGSCRRQTLPYIFMGFYFIQWFNLALKNKYISKYSTTHYKHNYIYQPIHPTIIHSFITLFIQHTNHSSFYSFIPHTIHLFIIQFTHSPYYSLTHLLTHSLTLIHSLIQHTIHIKDI